MNNITELVFILDMSGSMADMKSDTIGGFNSMLNEQKEKEGECFVTTVLFNTEYRTIHDRLPLEKVPEMTKKDYVPQSCTALIDAIGQTIDHIGNVHRYIRSEDVPAHTLFVIMTDGLENASRNYTSTKVKQMIEDRKKYSGWEFVFIGANIDAVETARHFGIHEDHAVDYFCDSEGSDVVYKSVSKLASSMRGGQAYNASWSAPIKENFKKKRR